MSLKCNKHKKFHLQWLYYKHMAIVNDDSSIVNKLETSLSDDARVVIYGRHMFIVQATDVSPIYIKLMRFLKKMITKTH